MQALQTLCIAHEMIELQEEHLRYKKKPKYNILRLVLVLCLATFLSV